MWSRRYGFGQSLDIESRERTGVNEKRRVEAEVICQQIRQRGWGVNSSDRKENCRAIFYWKSLGLGIKIYPTNQKMAMCPYMMVESRALCYGALAGAKPSLVLLTLRDSELKSPIASYFGEAVN